MYNKEKDIYEDMWRNWWTECNSRS